LRSSRSILHAGATIVIAALTFTASTDLTLADRTAALDTLEAAKLSAPDIPGQAAALVALAWPDDGPSDPWVRCLARQQLVDFGSNSMPALRVAVKTINPIYRADATATLVAARRSERFGNPPDFWPGLEEAIWFGSIEAQRLGMIELSRYPFPPAILTIIDAIYAHPELTVTGLRALGRMRNHRTRHFLRRALGSADPAHRKLAGDGLVLLGDPTGFSFLRDAVRSTDRGTRESALGALLPHATPEDVTLLHEYVTTHAKDDPALLAEVRDKTTELEAALQDQLVD